MAELVDPKNKFAVSVSNIHQTENKKLAYSVNFASELKLLGRQSKWVKGVQLYSISAEGQAKVLSQMVIGRPVALAISQ